MTNLTYDPHHTMSIEPGVSYRIINTQSGLAVHLSGDNSIVANPIDNTSRRQVVSIACSFNSFCNCTHNILVAPSALTRRSDFPISRNRADHWICWRPEGRDKPCRWRSRYCQSLVCRTGTWDRTEVRVWPYPFVLVTTPKFDLICYDHTRGLKFCHDVAR